MEAPPELITRVNFHIEGEKTSPLAPDIKSGISQLVPTGLQLNQINHTSLAQLQQQENMNTKTCGIPQTVLGIQTESNAIPTCSPRVEKLPNKPVSKKKPKNKIAVQILRSIYGLKQSGRIWYQ